jgi:transposase
LCAPISIARARPKKRRRASGRAVARWIDDQDPRHRRRARQSAGDPTDRGQVHDITQAEALLAEIEPQALIADKGYDADGFIEALSVRPIAPVIPPKANRRVSRPCNFALYAERNLVERFFNALKQFRAIATRYEKTARNFLAGIHLASLAWLK